MRRLRLTLAAMIALIGAVQAQTVNDLVQVWLMQHQIADAQGLYALCDPSVTPVKGTDGICAWNSGVLGVQPTPQQLLALAAAWQNQQKSGQFADLVAGGIAITSTATAALNATYATDDTATARLTFILVRLAGGKGLPGGGANFQYPDKAGAAHTFTGAQIANLGQAVQDYLYALYLARLSLAAGNAANWPTASATIP